MYAIPDADVFVLMHTHLSLCMCAGIQIFVCMCMCTYTYVHARMYGCMYVCVYGSSCRPTYLWTDMPTH